MVKTQSVSTGKLKVVFKALGPGFKFISVITTFECLQWKISASNFISFTEIWSPEPISVSYCVIKNQNVKQNTIVILLWNFIYTTKY